MANNVGTTVALGPQNCCYNTCTPDPHYRTQFRCILTKWCFMQALNAPGRCNTLFDHIVNKTKRLGGFLRRCSFRHVHCDQNRLVQGLVRRAISSTDTDVLVEDLSRDLNDVF
ncbi:hypothetical protein SO802_004851 [Lithocarpus litseifolius]|uniref:Uncharacterized protein n=1 Tax=Lithocarpus litseifolius TaxID=425828 RepID=A0AAW2DJI6_9ROSI